MKKKMLYLAALLCCLFTFTSCGDDGDDGPTSEATGTYTITFSPDFFKVAKHVNIYYKGANGENKNDVVMAGSVLPWTKTIKSTRFPAELGYKIVIEPKEESEITDGTYTLEVVGAINGAVNTGGFFSNNQQMLNKTEFKAGETSKMLKWLKDNKEKSYGYKLGKDGNAIPYTPAFGS
ncbi:MAG: hypothetical protein J5565_00420 [Muribaculaceae bacterium]|nr:hypothetical protein [Muribaculaceae bacterium]